MSDKELCNCGDGGCFTDKISKNTLTYKGKSKEVDCHYSECDKCQSEMTNHTQMYSNKMNAIEFYEEVDNV